MKRVRLSMALLLLSGAAHAEPRTWDVGASAAYVVVGGGRPTGGLMPSIAGRRVWQAGKAEISLGAHLGLFGLGGGSHWVGVLAGPTAGISGHLTQAWTVGAGLDFDIGRVPVCNNWRPEPLCIRWIGFFPAVDLGGAYAVSQHAEITATLTVRAVNTWFGAWPTFEPTAGGRFFW